MNGQLKTLVLTTQLFLIVMFLFIAFPLGATCKRCFCNGKEGIVENLRHFFKQLDFFICLTRNYLTFIDKTDLAHGTSRVNDTLLRRQKE